MPKTRKELREERREARANRPCRGAGLLIPAGLLVGMGIGFLYNNLVPGLFIGLGVGLLLAAVIKLLCK